MFDSHDSSTTQMNSNSSSLGQVLRSTFSYGGNIMLAAIISLLVVILFVLLLHLYAKWFLSQARQRRRSSMSVSHVLGPSRFHHFHTFTFDTILSDNYPTKGLDPSIIALIPAFAYGLSEDKTQHGGALECVICLSSFEDSDVVRKLQKCGHCFHVDCIDMWLHSHSSCPICRAPVVCEKKADEELIVDPEENVVFSGEEGVELAALDDLDLVDSDTDRLEIVIEIPGFDNARENVLRSAFSPSQSNPALGHSLKRMLSRNRSESNKVFPSTVN